MGGHDLTRAEPSENGISALMKGTPESPLPSPTTWGRDENSAPHTLPEPRSARILSYQLPALGKVASVVDKSPVLILPSQPRQTESPLTAAGAAGTSGPACLPARGKALRNAGNSTQLLRPPEASSLSLCNRHLHP